MTDQTIPDTSPPPPPPPETHGFLEQFEALAHDSLANLKTVVEQGLQATERLMIIKLSLKLLTLSMLGAKEEDFTPEMKSEVEALLEELQSLPFQP